MRRMLGNLVGIPLLFAIGCYLLSGVFGLHGPNATFGLVVCALGAGAYVETRTNWRIGLAAAVMVGVSYVGLWVLLVIFVLVTDPGSFA
jgi:hypothetical protein